MIFSADIERTVNLALYDWVEVLIGFWVSE